MENFNSDSISPLNSQFIYMTLPLVWCFAGDLNCQVEALSQVPPRKVRKLETKPNRQRYKYENFELSMKENISLSNRFVCISTVAASRFFLKLYYVSGEERFQLANH